MARVDVKGGSKIFLGVQGRPTRLGMQRGGLKKLMICHNKQAPPLLPVINDTSLDLA